MGERESGGLVLSKLRQLLTQQPEDEHADALTLNLAAACLLFEVIWADHEISPNEEEMLLRVVQEELRLSADDAEALISDTRDAQSKVVGSYEHARVVNQHYDAEQKITLVERLWMLAFSDGGASAIEEHTIRRIAELLYVAHSDFIRCKQRARANTSGR